MPYVTRLSLGSNWLRMTGVGRGRKTPRKRLKNSDISTERGRFELPLPLRADRFSKPAHSTTLPPLRAVAGVYAPPVSPSKHPATSPAANSPLTPLADKLT